MKSRHNLVKAYLSRLQSTKVSHPHFSGPSLNAGELDARDLGELLPVAWQVFEDDTASQPARSAAREIIHRAEIVAPEFSPEACQARRSVVESLRIRRFAAAR